MTQPESRPVRGLVLAGGGAKGAYQIGAYQALQEIGWMPDLITGTSVGCLNAALFVVGKVEEAAELWKSLDIHGVLETPQGKSPEELQAYLLDVLRGGGLDLEPLGETIDRYIDEEAMRAAPIGYGLVMTEMNTLKSVPCPLAEIPRGKLKEYMLASSACFPALRPRVIDGVKYIDGGWRDNMPLDLAASMGATELVAIDIEGWGHTRPNRTGWILTAGVRRATSPSATLIRCGPLAGWAAQPMRCCRTTTTSWRILPRPTKRNCPPRWPVRPRWPWPKRWPASAAGTRRRLPKTCWPPPAAPPPRWSLRPNALG